MYTLFIMGCIFFFMGYRGLSTIDKTATYPKLSKREVILVITLLLGIICLTASTTLYIFTW